MMPRLFGERYLVQMPEPFIDAEDDEEEGDGNFDDDCEIDLD